MSLTSDILGPFASSFGAEEGSEDEGGTRLIPENGFDAAAGVGAVGKREMPEKGLLEGATVVGAAGASSPALRTRTFRLPASTDGSTGCHWPGSSCINE